MAKIVLATANQGKVRELADLLGKTGHQIIAQSDLHLDSVEETGLTYVENALLKARYAAEKTGLPAIADDSGLSVNALSGAPGIYSARYAGEPAVDEKNIRKLLAEMHSVPAGKRQAQFHCVLVFLRHAKDPVPLICHGQWQGEIAFQVKGDGGFGYDPVFYIPELRCTAAELEPEKKRLISHRGQALQQLLKLLADDYFTTA